MLGVIPKIKKAILMPFLSRLPTSKWGWDKEVTLISNGINDDSESV
jgi:hypothetical protein